MTKIITGFHSIEEKVKAVSVNQNSQGVHIYFSKQGPRVKKILAEAGKAHILFEQVDDKKLNQLVSSLEEPLRDHRGIVMTVELSKDDAKTSNIVDFDQILRIFSNQKGRQTVVVLDCITDPHNIGAIIRSCDQFGVSLVVVSEHNSVSDIAGNEVIGRTSAGSSAWVPLSVVNNLVRAVERLKDSGFWIYGADAGGESLGKIEFPEKTCIIMGSEGTGISQLLAKKCDSIVSIPTCGKIDSLNVSVAAGIFLYELYRRQN